MPGIKTTQAGESPAVVMQVNRAEIFLFGFLDLATLLEGIGVGVHPHSGVVRIGCQIIAVNLTEAESRTGIGRVTFKGLAEHGLGFRSLFLSEQGVAVTGEDARIVGGGFQSELPGLEDNAVASSAAKIHQ